MTSKFASALSPQYFDEVGFVPSVYVTMHEKTGLMYTWQ